MGNRVHMITTTGIDTNLRARVGEGRLGGVRTIHGSDG